MVENRDRDRLIAKPCLAFSRDNEFLESLSLSLVQKSKPANTFSARLKATSLSSSFSLF